MTNAEIKELLLLTVTQPRLAAQRVLALNLPKEVLWPALVGFTALNVVIYHGGLMLMPLPEEQMAQMPVFLTSPMLFATVMLGGLVLTVFVLTWMGLMLGGQGAVDEMLAAIVWLQVLRVALQLVLFVLTLASPALAYLVMVAASVYGLYILAAFIAEVHRFDNLMKALGVMVLTVMSVAFGLSFIFAALGLTAATGGV